MIVTGNSFQVFPIWLGDSYCQPVWWNDRGWFFFALFKRVSTGSQTEILISTTSRKTSDAAHHGPGASSSPTPSQWLRPCQSCQVNWSNKNMELRTKAKWLGSHWTVTEQSLNITEVSTSVYLVHLLYPIDIVEFQHPTDGQVSPSSGSWHGGALLEIAGRGFHPETFRQEVLIRLTLQNGTIQDSRDSHPVLCWGLLISQFFGSLIIWDPVT